MHEFTKEDEQIIENLAKHFFYSLHSFRPAFYQMKGLVARLLETEAKYNEKLGVVRVAKVVVEDENA